MRKFIWKHHSVISIAIAVVIIYIIELTLLHYKYNLFLGGFLQQYTYRTISARFIFLILALIYDVVFYGLIASIWFYIAKKIRKYHMMTSIYFFIFITFPMGVILAVKYKLLSYFSDTVNLAVIQNLGGGTLRETFLYASSEIALAGLGVLLAIVIIFVILRFLKNSDFVKLCPQDNERVVLLRDRVLFISVLFFISFLTFSISSYDLLSYGLRKKTSYRRISRTLNRFSDFDFDGYGSFSRPKDSDIFNAQIFPGALDIPGNGIDEDGLLGDAVDSKPVSDAFDKIAAGKGKHIILIVLESARFDLLEKKFDGNYVAPNMRNVAADGFVAKYAYSHTGYTTTSIKAIFNRTLTKNKAQTTLVNFLRDSGYQLSFISGQGETFGGIARDVGMKKEGNHFFDAETAIDDRVYVSKEPGSLRLSEERVIEEFLTRVDDLDFSKPQFIYLNFQAAHFPYSHKEMRKTFINHFIPRSKIDIGNKKWVSQTYWNAIASADWAVGQVVEYLKKKHLYNNSTLVILGDHGEALFDNGFLGHGHATNDIQTRIPLIINDPNVLVTQAIGQTDVAELIVSSAFSMETNFTNQKESVFQLVGNLSKPVLIAHVSYEGLRTIYDFRTEQVFFSDTNRWKPYREVVLNELERDRLVALIREWEKLRWDEYEATQ